MPAVAMTATVLFTVNVPISTRNSLTNGEVPGSASEARPAKKNTPASTGTSLPAPPKSLDQRAAAPAHQHADDQEQQAGGEAVVDHVEHGAGAGLGGEGEDADADEAEVRDRGVRDQPLEVVLADREQRAVDDADQRQRERRAARSSFDAFGNSGRQ